MTEAKSSRGDREAEKPPVPAKFMDDLAPKFLDDRETQRLIEKNKGWFDELMGESK